MDTKQQINQIIQKRKEKAAELQIQREEFAKLRMALKKINGLEHKKSELTNDEMRKEFILKFKGLELKEAMRQADELMREYDTVIKRLSKDYISIATIGKERQGKSQFLQSVSRLSNDVIPAYDGTSCTGATSIIVNDYTVPEGQLRAVITYKKREDLIELVRDYVRTINPAYPTDDIDFDSIEYLPINSLWSSAGTDADKQSALRHLTNIVDHFTEFCDCFGMEPETYTNPEDIKKIVAQNNGRGADDPLCERYYKYLAVARADIYCRFFYDAGKVRLIDTIGIESTQIGVEQAMLDTVKNESDAAIVVTRPIAAPQIKDNEIYQGLTKAFADKAPEKWLFYLVNHFKGQNDHTVHDFDNGISGWGIAGHMIVDCSDEADVNNRFMRTVLETLLGNIDEIDGLYMNRLKDRIRVMKAKIDQLMAYIGNLSGKKSNNGAVALIKGKDCFHAMGAQLRRIVDHYYHEVNEPNNILWTEIQKVLDTLDADIAPDAETIQNVADNNNVLGSEVWNTMLHYVRNEITRRFVAIDDELARENIRFKNSLVKVLYDNLTDLLGESGDVNDDSFDMTKKLRELMEDIIAGDEKYAQIYEAIVFLDNFSFNTRAAIIQIVRGHLGIINPLSEEYAAPEINFRATHCGKEINYFLTSRLSLIEENLRHALIGIYNTPNKAFYAVAEEFYDKLTFAATDISKGRITSMADVWGAFFQTYSDMIWSDAAKESEVLMELNTEIKALKPVLESCLKVIGG